MEPKAEIRLNRQFTTELSYQSYLWCKRNGVLAIIDGVQRLSTIRDFIDSKFALSRNLKPVVINGEEKNIAGLRFKKMDENTQEALLNSELQVYEISEYTDEDVREMFRRQNGGTALKPSQKLTNSQSKELTHLLFELSSYPFIQKVLTPTQIKKDVDRDICREVLMLASASKEHPVTSFEIGRASCRERVFCWV